MKKYLYVLPTLFTIIYVVFVGVCWANNFNINKDAFITITLIFTIPVVLHIVQTIAALLDSIKNKKYGWTIVLLIFNIVMLPYYTNKYILKKVILKNTIITYLVSIIFMCTLMGVYTMTLVGKNTDLVVTTIDERAEFDLSSNWKVKDYPGYSLYAENNKKKTSFGVMAFDLRVFEGLTQDIILEDQKNYLAAKVESIELLDDVKELKENDKTIKTVVYKVKEIDKKEYDIYVLSVITFTEDSNYVLYVFEQVSSNNYEKYKNDLEEIIKEVKLK